MEDRSLLSLSIQSAVGVAESNVTGAQSVATDSAGNSYVTGNFTGAVNFNTSGGNTTLTSGGTADIFVAKYNSVGGLVWVKQFTGSGAALSQGAGIAVDPAGNVYSTGEFQGTVNFNPGGTFNLTALGGSGGQPGQALYVSKLDTNGNFVYADMMTGASGLAAGRGIGLDGTGNLYVNGLFQGTIDFDPGAAASNLTAAGKQDVFVLKLSNAGALSWADQFGGTGATLNSGGLAVDANGNVYSTGSFDAKADFDPSAGTSFLTPVGGKDVFISKLDTNGAFGYAKQMGGASDDVANGIAASPQGRVYVTGYFMGTANFNPAGTANLTSNGGKDAFVAALDNTGAFAWAHSFGSTADDTGNDVGVDGSGNVYAVGNFAGTVNFNPAGTANLTSNGGTNSDAFFLEMTSGGNYLSATNAGGAGFDSATAVAVSSLGGVSAVGRTTPPSTIGGFTMPTVAGAPFDFFVARLANTGATAGDYDGDGKADIGVYRPNSSQWFITQSSAGFLGTYFGAPGDIPVPADYDGDGKTDIAVYRPQNSTWYIEQSSKNNALMVIPFGAQGDIPVPGNYDGVGHAQVAIYRPGNGTWWILSASGAEGFQFGAGSVDRPIPADYDGDGKTDLAVYRTTTSQWFIRQSTAGPIGTYFGSPGDTPVPADYDGDGKADIAIYRPSNGGSAWYMMQSTSGFAGTFFGTAGDIPIPADYDGVGHAEIAVYRPSTSQWFISQPGGNIRATYFGQANLDVPLQEQLSLRTAGMVHAFSVNASSVSAATASTPGGGAGAVTKAVSSQPASAPGAPGVAARSLVQDGGSSTSTASGSSFAASWTGRRLSF